MMEKKEELDFIQNELASPCADGRLFKGDSDLSEDLLAFEEYNQEMKKVWDETKDGGRYREFALESSNSNNTSVADMEADVWENKEHRRDTSVDFNKKFVKLSEEKNTKSKFTVQVDYRNDNEDNEFMDPKGRQMKKSQSFLAGKNFSFNPNNSNENSRTPNLKTCAKKIENIFENNFENNSENSKIINNNKNEFLNGLHENYKKNNKYISNSKLLGLAQKDSGSSNPSPRTPYNNIDFSPCSETTCQSDMRDSNSSCFKSGGSNYALNSPSLTPKQFNLNPNSNPYTSYHNFFPSLSIKNSTPFNSRKYSESNNNFTMSGNNSNINYPGSSINNKSINDYVNIRKFSYPVEQCNIPGESFNNTNDYSNYSSSSSFYSNNNNNNNFNQTGSPFPTLGNTSKFPVPKSPTRNLNFVFEAMDLSEPTQSKGKKHLDDAVNRINIENILKGKDKRTTLMIRHIPNKYNLYTFLEDINMDFKGTYDVFYLPIDYKNNCNLGFAFINFVDPMHILGFYNAFRGNKWRRFKSDKICELAYAKFQGKEELKTHFLNGSVIKLDSEDKKPVILPTPDPLPPVQIPLVRILF